MKRRPMDEEKLIRLIASLEKKLIASRIDLSKVDLIIHYYIGWTPIDIRDLPIKVVVHIFTQNQSNPVDMDFYYLLTDRLTTFFNIFSIDDVEFLYSKEPFPIHNGDLGLENRIFHVIEKPIDLGLQPLFELDF
jgi:hypothetical protein